MNKDSNKTSNIADEWLRRLSHSGRGAFLFFRGYLQIVFQPGVSLIRPIEI